jgi:hypothetical protein
MLASNLEAQGLAAERCKPRRGRPCPTETPTAPAATQGATATAPSNATAPAPGTSTPAAPTPTTAGPVPTRPSGGSAPYPGAPLCPSHDPRVYHSLWDSARGCHYDHHHGDDPHALDDLLGTDLFAKMGGEISYPWQTSSQAGLENDLKHAGYFWHVRRDIPCDGVPSPCISAFRVLVHQHPTDRDATVQYHSYAFEFRTSDGGYGLFGGWADFGDLHAPEGTVVLNVPDNHDSYRGGGAGRHKQHAVEGGPRAPSFIWYGASRGLPPGQNGPRGFVTLSVSIQDPWDWTDPANPSRTDDYVCHGHVSADACRSNGTNMRPHLMGFNVDTRFPFIDADGNGQVDFEGYADRYGQPYPDGGGCSAYGVDCAPVVMRGLRYGYNYETADVATALSSRDHDIYFCNGAPCAPRDRGARSSGWSQPVP